MVNIGLLTFADERFGAGEDFEQFLGQQYNGSIREFLKDRKKAAMKQRLEILLAGRVEIPQLICQKGLDAAFEVGVPNEVDANEKTTVVPLCVKKTTGMQKFRIPFKNTGSLELDLEFTFMPNSAPVNKLALVRSNSNGVENPN